MHRASDRLAHLDALRGVAILGVVAVHAGQRVDLSGISRAVFDAGQTGVQLFFVVSAIALCHTVERHSDDWRGFFVRRLFRLAPLFYFAIALYAAVAAARAWLRPDAGDPHSVADVLLNAAFLHGFAPSASVVPGGWSIAAEAFFYALFPAVYVLQRRLTDAWAASMLAAVSVVALGLAWAWGAPLVGMTPLPHLPAFLAGVMAWRALQAGRSALLPLPISLCCAVGGWWLLSAGGSLFVPTLVGLAYADLAVRAASLRAPALAALGRVSYGVYVVHFVALSLIGAALPVAGAAGAAALTAATVVVSAVAAMLLAVVIERPGIKLGARLSGGSPARPLVLSDDRPRSSSHPERTR